MPVIILFLQQEKVTEDLSNTYSLEGIQLGYNHPTSSS